VGQKISITSRKAQTTRHRITGIRTRRADGGTQFVFVDTPGFQTRHSTALNKSLNKTVQGAIDDVDVVLFVVEAGSFTLTMPRCCRCSSPDKPAAGGQQAGHGAPPRETSRPGCRHAGAPPVCRIRAHVGQERDVARLLEICAATCPSSPGGTARTN
jgi:GTP-binding protein Era